MSKSPRSDALYYYKKSLQYKDTAKAERWKAEYMRLGGDREGLINSVQRAHPLAGLPVADRQAFAKSLTLRDRQALAAAEKWYQQVYQTRPQPRLSRVK
jgi:hypothetical protein